MVDVGKVAFRGVEISITETSVETGKTTTVLIYQGDKKVGAATLREVANLWDPPKSRPLHRGTE